MTHSVKMMDESKIVGIYLLNEKVTIREFFQLRESTLKKMVSQPHLIPQERRDSFEHLARTLLRYPGNGIQGIAVVLLSGYRGKGIGRRLLDYPYTLSQQYDYIWGGHESNLHNLYHWLKRRELLFEHQRTYYTIGSLKKTP